MLYLNNIYHLYFISLRIFINIVLAVAMDPDVKENEETEVRVLLYILYVLHRYI